ncbi:MAG: DNA repair protein RadA, partial [Oscillospiraceae bacterium]
MKDKLKTVYVCTSCGETSLRWLGRCPSCGEWNTMQEDVVKEVKKAVNTGPSASRIGTGSSFITATKLS